MRLISFVLSLVSPAKWWKTGYVVDSADCHQDGMARIAGRRPNSSCNVCVGLDISIVSTQEMLIISAVSVCFTAVCVCFIALCCGERESELRVQGINSDSYGCVSSDSTVCLHGRILSLR